MTRQPAYPRAIFEMKPGSELIVVRSLEEEYRELQMMRERVRMAEIFFTKRARTSRRSIARKFTNAQPRKRIRKTAVAF
jgi:hypothetical protein